MPRPTREHPRPKPPSPTDFDTDFDVKTEVAYLLVSIVVCITLLVTAPRVWVVAWLAVLFMFGVWRMRHDALK
jgi:hypothetical protein